MRPVPAVCPQACCSRRPSGRSDAGVCPPVGRRRMSYKFIAHEASMQMFLKRLSDVQMKHRYKSLVTRSPNRVAAETLC